MARYIVHVKSAKSPEEAFAYMANLENFAEWDPGVESSAQVVGDDISKGAAFDVAVKGFKGPITLRYFLTTYEPPTSFVALAESKMLTSLDKIDVRSQDGGSVISYDAELKLKGFLAIANPLLALAFKRIGDKAAAGLVKAFDGEIVAGLDS